MSWSGLVVDWEEVTGQSRFVIDMLTIPIFSAIAGLLTNWTGVWMLFAPNQFRGFDVPGLRVIYPYFPRRLQILPIFEGGHRLGFQGFIPARTEKMASLTVDLAISKIGGPSDFYCQLEPEAIAAQFAQVIGRDLRPLVDSVMESGYPQLWNDLPQQVREMLYARVASELPDVAGRAFDEIGRHIDELLDVKSMVIGHLRKHPAMMKDIFYSIGAPELRFMVRSGLLGFPMGVALALYLHFHPHLPLVGAVPLALVVLFGAAMIGVIANIIAIRVVFTPAVRRPRWQCLWGQALLAQRQEVAAADFGYSIAHQIITMDTIVDHLMEGPNRDKTRGLLENVLVDEIDRALGVIRPLVRATVGTTRWQAIQAGSTMAAIDYVPALVDADFSLSQAAKIDRLCTEKLQELPPEEFVDLLYSAIEQDAWLLYVHGGLLGIVVGAVHLIVFGV